MPGIGFMYLQGRYQAMFDVCAAAPGTWYTAVSVSLLIVAFSQKPCITISGKLSSGRKRENTQCEHAK